MNDQIKELLKKAQHITAENHVPGGRDYEREIYVTFAELIVKECAETMGSEIVYNDNYNERNKAISDMITLVKNHFGVEE